MWYQIKLPWEETIAGLELDAGSSRHDFPRGYQVELSNDGKQWSTAAVGRGTSALTEITFPPAKTKYIRITETDSVEGHNWTIGELQVLKPAPPPLPSAGAKKSAPNPYD